MQLKTAVSFLPLMVFFSLFTVSKFVSKELYIQQSIHYLDSTITAKIKDSLHVLKQFFLLLSILSFFAILSILKHDFYYFSFKWVFECYLSSYSKDNISVWNSKEKTKLLTGYHIFNTLPLYPLNANWESKLLYIYQNSRHLLTFLNLNQFLIYASLKYAISFFLHFGSLTLLTAPKFVT